jgi:hypothetical protein
MMAAASSAWLPLAPRTVASRQVRRSARQYHLDGRATQDRHGRLVEKAAPSRFSGLTYCGAPGAWRASQRALCGTEANARLFRFCAAVS